MHVPKNILLLHWNCMPSENIFGKSKLIWIYTFQNQSSLNETCAKSKRNRAIWFGTWILFTHIKLFSIDITAKNLKSRYYKSFLLIWLFLFADVHRKKLFYFLTFIANQVLSSLCFMIIIMVWVVLYVSEFPSVKEWNGRAISWTQRFVQVSTTTMSHSRKRFSSHFFYKTMVYEYIGLEKKGFSYSFSPTECPHFEQNSWSLFCCCWCRVVIGFLFP